MTQDATTTTAGSSPVAGLARLGTAPWLDSISRAWLDSGELVRLRDRYGLRGVTSNPTIFQQALAGDDYDADIRELAGEGLDTRTIFHRLAIDDIRRACDVFAPVHAATGDGHVSIEVDPDLAHDADATISQARALHAAIDRPNVMIKVPATRAGLEAIEQLLFDGISVNVTLLFSVERYRDVMDRWITALERRASDGRELAGVASVASFFVSRVDAKADALLDGDSPLRGRVALANAIAAFDAHRTVLGGRSWASLERAGAEPQRPLWASTGTKNPDYSDILYVQELISGGTVNTMPLKTIEAFDDHGEARVTLDDDAIERAYDDLGALREAGVDLHAVTDELETEGVASFEASFRDLLAGIETKREALVG